MYFRLMGKLNARRNGLLAEDEKGFTLIELLVVVIIIGILAAIAIPVYLGVQKNAKDSAVKTDITNLKTALVSLETSANGAFPTDAAVTTTNIGSAATWPSGTANPPTDTWKDAGATLSQYTSSAGIKITPGGTAGAFTICATDGDTNNSFSATDSTGVAKAASC